MITIRLTTVVGNDVWIGIDSYIRDGVRVGDGAIVGAHSVVTRDVPPYAIVAGNPARMIRMRFPEAIVERLLALQWWRYNIYDFGGVDVSDIERSIAWLEDQTAAGRIMALPSVRINLVEAHRAFTTKRAEAVAVRPLIDVPAGASIEIPMDDDAYFDANWGHCERDGALAYRWMIGKMARVSLPLRPGADVAFAFRFGLHDACGPQRIRIGIGDRELLSAEIDHVPYDGSVMLPGALLDAHVTSIWINATAAALVDHDARPLVLICPRLSISRGVGLVECRGPMAAVFSEMALAGYQLYPHPRKTENPVRWRPKGKRSASKLAGGA